MLCPQAASSLQIQLGSGALACLYVAQRCLLRSETSRTSGQTGLVNMESIEKDQSEPT